ncbi:hypothetical protein CIG75_18815 [Tumebacillus algifaecis]|uniref:GrpB family protein n=1 Tax=Tumebacillus algifaecis TaxID=1214604 RepID=A0A223D5E6_9BACL|nr:GrpB family protein [Tumebacillus algifaecis]ASS76791.1 hypothetical protein CIG75_18815 [Tumebacillus algifaecis]
MERVQFAEQSSFHQAAERLFAEQKARIISLLPAAQVEHVGSTAVPGSLTKGDLDIQVRVAKADFERAVELLSELYPRNEGNLQTDSFCSFQADQLLLPLGVQLTAFGSEYDFFWKFREVMLANPSYVDQYNQLKRHFQGNEMDAYRIAKHEFFQTLMQSLEFQALTE